MDEKLVFHTENAEACVQALRDDEDTSDHYYVFVVDIQ